MTIHKQVEAISVNVSIGGKEVRVTNVYLPHGAPDSVEEFAELLKNETFSYVEILM